MLLDIIERLICSLLICTVQPPQTSVELYVLIWDHDSQLQIYFQLLSVICLYYLNIYIQLYKVLVSHIPFLSPLIILKDGSGALINEFSRRPIHSLTVSFKIE